MYTAGPTNYVYDYYKQNQHRLLHRNIKLFGVYQIFTKRVFMPLMTIYAVEQAGLNIQQIGIIAMLSSILGLISDSPTGYWADRHGRKRSSQVGAFLTATGSLVYVFSNNIAGILFASLLSALGYSFLYGSMQALIHDTLIVLKKENEYSKIASRAQALSLIGNAIFIGFVPLLYPIDRRLPFLLGFFAYCSLFIIATLLHEPERPKVHHSQKLSFVQTVRLFVHKKTLLFYLSIGVIFATGTSTSDVFNLGLIDLGMPVKFLGFAFAAGSIFGAIVGLHIHRLKKFKFETFALIDFCFSFFPFIAYGITRSLPVALVSLILSMATWRFEIIMYQHYILDVYRDTHYKATVLSLLTNFRSLQEIWMTLVITGAAQHFGVLSSIGYGTLFMLALLPVLLYSVKNFSTNARASSESLNQLVA